MTEHLIQRLGHLGEGIAEGPIFAPLTLPGEVVTGDVQGNRLATPKIVTPSPDRVAAPCRHFKTCGGCALQHASDAFVAGWKQEVVRKALEAQGLTAQFQPIQTSPTASRRRATFSARRTKKGAMAGFHARGSDVLVEIPDCQLLRPSVLAGRDIAAELAVVGGSRKGELSVSVTDSLQGLDIAVTGGKQLDGALRVALAAVVAQHDLARLTWDDEVVAMAVPPEQPFGAARVVPPPGAFLQATSEGEIALFQGLKRAIGSAKSVVDLFAGCGTFSLPLAEQADVHAYEGEAEMIAALDKGWRMAKGLHKVQATTRDLFRNPLLPDELDRFDAIAIDPPRAGAQAQVAQIAESRVPVVGFVSCNPVTFARDARTLVDGGYALDWVQVVDQFRWSAHIEVVARFFRAT